jgi:hypothetical protein
MLDAGRELDALVGEKIFGYQKIAHYGPTKEHNKHLEQQAFAAHEEAMAAYKKFWPDPESWPEDTLLRWEEGWGTRIVENFSTDISDTWQLVEKMLADHPYANLHLVQYAYARTYAAFSTEQPGSAAEWSEGNGEYCTPVAICFAALAAVDASQ